MSIVVIPNQPVNLEPYGVDPCNIGDDKAYCQLFNIGDSIKLQFKQEPCGADLIDDGNFNADPSPWTIDSGVYDKWVYASTGDAGTDGMYCHVPGTSGDTIVQTLAITSGKYYSLKVTVSDRTAGTLTVNFGGSAITISENGTFTKYFTATGINNVTFTAGSTFDGCVSYVTAYELTNDYAVTLVDYVTGANSGNTPSIVYSKDFVTVTFDTSGMSEGCYRVEVVDQCLAQSTTYGANVIVDSTFADATKWDYYETDSAPRTVYTNILGGMFVSTVGDPAQAFYQGYTQKILGLSACWYKITLTTGDIDPNILDMVSDENLIIILLGNWNDIIATSGTTNILQANTTYTYYVYVSNFTPAASNSTYPPGAWSQFNAGVFFNRKNTDSCTGGESLIIASFTAQPADSCEVASLASNCLSVLTTHDCAKLIEGTCYDGTNEKNALGFLWDGNFDLTTRFRFLAFAPSYPTSGEDYEYSSGVRSLTYSKREKYYTGLLDYMDETGHDTMSTIILTDNFTIDDVRHLCQPKDYKPEWDKDGQLRLSQARIEVRKASGTIYNQNNV